MQRVQSNGLLHLLFLVALTVPGRTATPHYVFAHYMVCFPTYSETIQGYQREIKEAQAAGLDGFVLDVGAWDSSLPYYQTRVATIYNAAEQLGTGFKLSFFVEFPQPTNIVNLVSTYAARSNTFWYQGKVVLSAWGMNDLDWTNAVLAPLRDRGYPVFFIPHFWPKGFAELPTYSDAQYLLQNYAGFVNGLFLFGAAGLPSQLAQCNSNYTKAVQSAGKTFMASVTPHYWGCTQTSNGRRYFESSGGEGLRLQWTSVIANQPDWIDIVTWSDFNESTYISPVADVGAYFSPLQFPNRYSHMGYLEFSKHYISWFKTGHEPSIDHDSLFYFYRTHPITAVASDSNDVPVTSFYGNPQDVIYVSAFLTNSAQLETRSGGNAVTNSLPAGVTHVRIPFAPGTQNFTVRRNGQAVLSGSGPNIEARIKNYDFFPASGYLPRSPAPPGTIHVSSP